MGGPCTGICVGGVYVVIEAPNDYAAASFQQYGLLTDESGR